MAFMLVYWASGEFTWQLAPNGGTGTGLWLSAGIFTVVLLLWPLRAWPWFIGAAGVASAGFTLVHGKSLELLVGFYLANTAQAMTSAWLTRRWVAARPSLSSLGEFVGFMGTAVCAGPMLGATIGAGTLALSGRTAEWLRVWEQLAIGQGLAILLVAPAVFAWRPTHHLARSYWDRPGKRFEALLLFCGASVVVGIIFVHEGGFAASFKSRLLPFALWAGVRFGLKGATAFNLGLAALATVLTSFFSGELSPQELASGEPLARLQAFMAIGALVSLVPAIAVEERDRKVDDLRESESRQEEARQALVANETLLRQFVQHAPAAVAMFDRDMRYVQTSDRWLTEYKLEGGSVIGRSHYDVFPDIPERWKAVHRRVLGGAVEACEEDAFLRQDGTLDWIHWEGRPWRRADQSIGGLIMFTQVITERVRMRAALHASEERFRSAMHHSPIGMALVAVDGRLLEVNPALSSICGYTREDLLARDVQSLTHPDDLAADLAGMRHLVARKSDHYQIEKRCRHQAGHLVWIQLSVSLIWNPDGTPRHFVSQIQDITDRVQAQEHRAKLETQLRQAQKMEAIGTLAGGIAHDFNNILAGVMGNLQLAEMELSPEHAAGPLLNEAMRASRRARDLVARILTFSRRTENRRTPTALGPIIEEAVQLLRATVPATIELHTKLASDCRLVRCDSAQIHQVILNLGGNAPAAMRERGGRIELELRQGPPARDLITRHPHVRPDHLVCLVVRDDGHGMAAAVRERIFEPFFTTKGPGEGTGLGLAVVHGIIQDLGGAIVVESEVGQGTTFEIYLPACDETGTPVAVPREASTRRTPELPGKGERIMVVDDDATVLAVAASILRRHGYRPEPFSQPARALAAFETDPNGYAMVVSDLTMPGLTGFELARRLRALNPRLPVLVASGYLDEQSSAELDSLPRVGRMDKPYDVDGLVQAVRASLRGEYYARRRDATPATLG